MKNLLGLKVIFSLVMAALVIAACTTKDLEPTVPAVKNENKEIVQRSLSKFDCDPTRFPTTVYLKNGSNCEPHVVCLERRRQAHFISGQLLFSNDSFEKNQKGSSKCLKPDRDNIVRVAGQYKVEVPVDYLKNRSFSDSEILVGLYENGLPMTTDIVTTVAELPENNVLPLTQTNIISKRNHYKFCGVNEFEAPTGNAVTYVYVFFNFVPTYEISDVIYKDYTLFLAIIDDHSHVGHPHKDDDLNHDITDAIATGTLDALEILNNSSSHVAEHIELIKLNVCPIESAKVEEVKRSTN